MEASHSLWTPEDLLEVLADKELRGEELAERIWRAPHRLLRTDGDVAIGWRAACRTAAPGALDERARGAARLWVRHCGRGCFPPTSTPTHPGLSDPANGWKCRIAAAAALLPPLPVGARFFACASNAELGARRICERRGRRLTNLLLGGLRLRRRHAIDLCQELGIETLMRVEIADDGVRGIPAGDCCGMTDRGEVIIAPPVRLEIVDAVGLEASEEDSPYLTVGAPFRMVVALLYGKDA